MKRFLTKYDIKHFDGVTMNPYDAVDRLSYVDSTSQIVRMLQAGVNMKLQRSQLIGDDRDMNCPSMPVYAPDISVAYRQLHEMQDQLKENQKKLTEALKARKEAEKVSPEGGANSDLPSQT